MLIARILTCLRVMMDCDQGFLPGDPLISIFFREQKICKNAARTRPGESEALPGVRAAATRAATSDIADEVITLLRA